MRVFNTGAGDFWHSEIGKQLRLLRLIYPQYHRAAREIQALAEAVSRQMLPQCRRFGKWPKLDVRNGALVFDWAARGEVLLALGGKRLSYTPDPIRRSNTVAMVIDPSACLPEAIDKFLRGALWHLLEVRP